MANAPQILLYWERQSARSIAELVLPVTVRYSHKYPHCVWADACITQQLLYNSVPPGTGCKSKRTAWNCVINENTWKNETGIDRLHICKVIYMPEKWGGTEISTHRPRRTEPPSAGWSGRCLHFKSHGSSPDECPLVSGLTSGSLNVTCFFRGSRKEKGLFIFWERAFCFHSMAQQYTDWWRLQAACQHKSTAEHLMAESRKHHITHREGTKISDALKATPAL